MGVVPYRKAGICLVRRQAAGRRGSAPSPSHSEKLNVPSIPQTRPGASRRLSLTGDPEAVALSCQQYITKRAHRLLDGRLGGEAAEFIAVDVWLWLTERRIAEPGFLCTTGSFRKAILRKLLEKLKKAERDVARVDRSRNVEEFVDAGTGGGGGKRLTIPDEIFAHSETIWYVQRAIAQLPLQMQRVIRLYDLEGWTASDVAIELDISPATVRRIRHDAKTRLRELLEPFGGLKAA